MNPKKEGRVKQEELTALWHNDADVRTPWLARAEYEIAVAHSNFAARAARGADDQVATPRGRGGLFWWGRILEERRIPTTTHRSQATTTREHTVHRAMPPMSPSPSPSSPLRRWPCRSKASVTASQNKDRRSRQGGEAGLDLRGRNWDNRLRAGDPPRPKTSRTP